MLQLIHAPAAVEPAVVTIPRFPLLCSPVRCLHTAATTASVCVENVRVQPALPAPLAGRAHFLSAQLARAQSLVTQQVIALLAYQIGINFKAQDRSDSEVSDESPLTGTDVATQYCIAALLSGQIDPISMKSSQARRDQRARHVVGGRCNEPPHLRESMLSPVVGERSDHKHVCQRGAQLAAKERGAAGNGRGELVSRHVHSRLREYAPGRSHCVQRADDQPLVCTLPSAYQPASGGKHT